MNEFLIIAWMLLAAFFLASAAVTVLRYRAPRPPGGEPPRCSIIMPIRGVHQHLATNLLALAKLAPFRGEILLAVARSDDPAVTVIEPIVARHPDTMRLLIGEAPEIKNPKVANLAKAYRAAREDTLLFLDDTVEMDGAVYGELLSALKPGIAMVTVAPVAREPENFPARIEAASCNGYLFRLEMLFELFGIAAAFGHAVAFRKADLEAAGGIRRLDEGPCDDNALSNALAGRGRLRLLPLSIVRRIGRRTWSETYFRHLRWKNCGKAHEPVGFLLEPLGGGLAFNVLGAYALSRMLGASPEASLGFSVMLWYGTEALIHLVAGWRFTPLDIIAWIMRDLLQPILTLAAIFINRVEWRGSTVDLHAADRERRPGRPS
jgi:ceramide glucosyltransferase